MVTALPLLLVQNEPYHIHLLFDLRQPEYLVNFLFLVLMCSICSYLIWNETMKKLGSVTANNYLYLQPPITMVAGYFFLGEKIFMLGYIGCALVIAGLDHIRQMERFNLVQKEVNSCRNRSRSRVSELLW